LRLLLFVLSALAFAVLDVERSKLIAATADPELSFSACVVSSSRASESQQNSQVRASRERPVASLGMKGAEVEERREMGPKGRADWER
jgi:hypothetical protein